MDHPRSPPIASEILNDDDERTIALVFDPGDEAMATLTHFAEEHGIAAAQRAIGAFGARHGGYFDWQRKDSERIPVHEQVEVVALVGDVALDGRPKIAARRDRPARRRRRRPPPARGPRPAGPGKCRCSPPPTPRGIGWPRKSGSR